MDRIVRAIAGIKSRGTRSITAVSVYEDRLVLELSPIASVEVKYREIQEVLLKKKWLSPGLLILSIDGSRYSAVSSHNGRITEAYEAICSQVQLYEVRVNWHNLDNAYASFRQFLNDPGYISDSQLLKFLTKKPMPELPDISHIREGLLTPEEAEVLRVLSTPRDCVNERNVMHVEQNMKKWAELFDTVESNPLTHQQKLAILHNEDNTLVLAGAGTGKTSTIVAKVGYLLKSRLAQPEDILLLSFTRKSANEMKERIAKRIGENVEVHTFHSLGLEIISSVEQKKPSILKEAEDDKALKKTLEALLETLFMSDFKLRSSYKQFVTSNLVPYRSRFQFRTEGEYMAYLKESGMRALSGEVLKSYEEIEIANWLYLNGVRYQYEKPYEIDTASIDHRQYMPDFYYPEYTIYHEHFGIRRDGSTAPFVDKEKYQAGMEWKRKLHKQHGTVLIETYSWMKEEGTLLLDLEEKLKEHNVKLAPLPPNDVLTKFREASFVNPLIDLLTSFLKLFKGSCFSEEEVRERAKNSGNYLRNQLFLNIFLPLYYAYEEKHRGSGEIDFDDMIQQALDYVRSGKYQSRFRYIIIDEFQDISHGRAMLVKALQEQVDDSRVFCVGDDWQAIYRFTGSDISLITEFPEFFGYTKTIALDRTFRFNNRIVDFSSEFILKNESQVRKTLTPNAAIVEAAIEVVEFGFNAEEAYVSILKSIMARTPTATVYFLGRYNNTVPDWKNLKEYRDLFPSLKIEAMTVHKSKGLEADYVIICDLSSGKKGFPCEITDDPVLELVLGKPDKFPHGEERRLFYVAVTRARKKVFLVVPRINPSAFAKEILEDPAYLINHFHGYQSYNEVYCPSCASGYLVIRNGKYGSFAGCSNYPLCEHKQHLCKQCQKGMHAPDSERPHVSVCNICGDEKELCPQCRVGFLQPRNGSHGPFLGCSMYRSLNCRYTRNLNTE